MKSMLKRVGVLMLVGVAFAACSESDATSPLAPEFNRASVEAAPVINIQLCKVWMDEDAKGMYEFDITGDDGGVGSVTLTAGDGTGGLPENPGSAGDGCVGDAVTDLTVTRGGGAQLTITEVAVGEGAILWDFLPASITSRFGQPSGNCWYTEVGDGIFVNGTAVFTFDEENCTSQDYRIIFKNIDFEVPSGGGEGCTPGFWRQDWPGTWQGYTSDQLFDDVFGGVYFPGMTLGEVVAQGGGGLKALGRHTVAALLNASSSVDYGMSTADVIAAFQDAVAEGGGAIETQKNIFADKNEDGCPLNANPRGRRGS